MCCSNKSERRSRRWGRCGSRKNACGPSNDISTMGTAPAVIHRAMPMRQQQQQQQHYYRTPMVTVLENEKTGDSASSMLTRDTPTVPPPSYEKAAALSNGSATGEPTAMPGMTPATSSSLYGGDGGNRARESNNNNNNNDDAHGMTVVNLAVSGAGLERLLRALGEPQQDGSANGGNGAFARTDGPRILGAQRMDGGAPVGAINGMTA